MINQPTTNKSSFRGESVNFHFFHKGILFEDKYAVGFGPTQGHVYPPISREELKGLADFINNYLENN